MTEADSTPDRAALLAARLDDLRRAVLEGDGVTDLTARRGAYLGKAFPGGAEEYLRKVWDASHLVTDADIQHLSAAGFSEDAIFELTIAAAMGAAERTLRAGLQALVRPKED